ncbi:MAG: RsmD family RNA methyltransferase [Proteobacteria bacterium]|nr:RsmD family RNA methyltransferase [Pseudomonadota bacterium]
MRIVAGRHRGRRLEAPAGMAVRPTADRTREALFNILTQGKLPWRAPVGGQGVGGQAVEDQGAERRANPLAGARALDAFAGTGALGLEALSRGAAFVTFMENQAAALAACRNNIALLEETARSQALRCDVLRPPPAPAPCDLVLMDPPYNQGLAAPALAALEAAGWLAPGALAVVELMAKEPFAPPEGFETLDERKYGKARLVFLRAPG